MEADALEKLFAEEVCFRQCARALGRLCLKYEQRIRDLRRDVEARARGQLLGRLLGALSNDTWEGLAHDQRPLSELWRLAAVSEFKQPTEHLPLIAETLLEALCLNGLVPWFAATRDTVLLECGDPFPVGSRDLRGLFPATPALSKTIDYDELLSGVGCRIWRMPDGSVPSVELVFRHRFVLDDATWVPQRGQLLSDVHEGRRTLPIIATVHPLGCVSELRVQESDDATFFGVGPTEPVVETALGMLTCARQAGADIAVLPELCLDKPDSLAGPIAENASNYPRVVVAGSAHIRDGDVRSNVSETYIDGVTTLVHTKIRPYLWRGQTAEGKFERREDLTPSSTLRILCGDHTRMAVAICSDVINGPIPDALKMAAVNLLLVPALSVKPGTFRSVATSLAEFSQAVTAVVNGSLLPSGTKAQPFMVVLGAPHEDDPSSMFATPPSGRRAVGRFDPAMPCTNGAFSWQAQCC
jgi:hypothetical protein